MGLIQAAAGAIGGTLADQWVDFLTVPEALSITAAVFPPILKGKNNQRGSNISPSVDVISNGSRIIVPEGYALVTFQDGAITSLVAEPGAYTWDSEDLNAKTIFTEGSVLPPIIKQSWERFKFGGRPGSQQSALFVNLQELPNNKFGTQSEIYWDDSFLGTQVGAIARGSYTLKIVDPLLFLKSFVPAAVTQNRQVFDFTNPSNEQGNQLFNEVVSVLAAAFSRYANDSTQGKRISKIQQDVLGFTDAFSKAVEEAYKWESDRGLQVSKVALVAVEYDEATKQLLQTVQRADALAGARGNSNMQASVAAGIQSAGEVGGAAGILGLGIAAGNLGLADLSQGSIPPSPNPTPEGTGSSLERLKELKEALELGLISQDDFDQAKTRFLGA
jgi:membrane protease subunit (stomatin/prohibitin family)